MTDDPRGAFARTELLRRIGHDIASPCGVAQTILDDLARADPAAPADRLDMARRSLRKLARIGENLSIVAELERGTLVVDPAPTELAPLVTRAHEAARGLDPRPRIETSWVPSAISLLAPVEERLLSVALRELLGNALKHATSRVAIELEVIDEIAHLRVDDDGPGFPDHIAAAPHQRLVPTGEQRGLGLGLSIAVDVVRAHGGDVTVTDGALTSSRHPRPGARVTVTLPNAMNNRINRIAT